jgi:hypothetical protein
MACDRGQEGAVGSIPEHASSLAHRLRELVLRPEHRPLTLEPIQRVPKADEKADPRRRRSLTEAELVQRLDEASRRPLLEVLTVHRGKEKREPMRRFGPKSGNHSKPSVESVR